MNHLRAFREEASLSQVHLAARADVALGAVVNFENNKTMPQLKTAQKLALTLGKVLERKVTVEDIWPTQELPDETLAPADTTPAS